MKKKLLTILLLATISILCAVLFVACNNGNATQKDKTAWKNRLILTFNQAVFWYSRRESNPQRPLRSNKN